ncbi:YggT family protein [uncultured Clostridium sp.]|uniref:YggT family protein n=1 Tax=uncultured Clostridium sp. TaxID=59620 RepID=UPI0026723471|nr:YggT family protein [uncultured Clostridium sp.]
MNVLNITILAEVIFSYIPNARAMNIYNILVSINNPILEPIRRLQIRFLGDMMIDFSPIVAILLLNMISGILIY